MTNGIPTLAYADFLSLHDQGFIVLGAGQGMGEQTVVALRQSGAEVLCVDRDEASAERVAEIAEGFAMRADVTRRDELEAVFVEADQRFGHRFRGVVDIVGGVHPKGLPDMTEEDWSRQFDLDFKHAYMTIQHAAPKLAANGGGALVFLGSLAGTRVRTGRMLPYSVAKAALHQLVQGSAKEWASKNVRMNVVAPGLVRSPRLEAVYGAAFWEAQSQEIPRGCPAEDADIAAAVLFFCTPMSRHVTGTVLAVDGGSHMNNESSYSPMPAG